MKQDINRLKDMILYNVLSYLETKENNFKLEAFRLLKEFGSHYNIKIKKVKSVRCYSALLEFINNESGYGININKLYNSI